MEFGFLVEEAIELIDCELEIVRMEWEQPEWFADMTCEAPDFGLHLTEKSKNLGIVGIAEVVIGLWLSEEIVGANGKPAPLVRIAEAFERMLGMNFGSIYDKLDAIFNNRKPFNRTKALDFLRALILREEKRRVQERKG